MRQQPHDAQPGGVGKSPKERIDPHWKHHIKISLYDRKRRVLHNALGAKFVKFALAPALRYIFKRRLARNAMAAAQITPVYPRGFA
jgi:hypothetical protein